MKAKLSDSLAISMSDFLNGKSDKEIAKFASTDQKESLATAFKSLLKVSEAMDESGLKNASKAVLKVAEELLKRAESK